jgi:hypothetical protein
MSHNIGRGEIVNSINSHGISAIEVVRGGFYSWHALAWKELKGNRGEKPGNFRCFFMNGFTLLDTTVAHKRLSPKSPILESDSSSVVQLTTTADYISDSCRPLGLVLT